MAVKALSADPAVVRMPYWSDPDYPGVEFDPDDGLTKQEFKDECDINNIMRRYNATGVVSHINSRQPEYGDFADPLDFQHSLNVVLEAQMMFADLPAELRDRFGNDPHELLKFLADPKNKDEAVSLGIVKAPEPDPEPLAVRVVADPDAAPAPKPKDA